MGETNGSLECLPVFALIPARGGSKGIPHKNLVNCAGQPLVLYTLQAAKESSVVHHVRLSSDDEEILSLGRDFGIDVIRRRAADASDDASAVDVVRHFFEVVDEPDLFLFYLQPTSPLRTAAHIDAAFREMREAGLDRVISVRRAGESPFKMFRIGEDGRLCSIFPEELSNARRQDLPNTFLPNGAIYGFTRHAFESRGGFPSNGSHPFLMEDEESVDVDTDEDLQRAELYLRRREVD